MRKHFCEALVARSERPDLVFLTGDLGFMALEPLQAKLGNRFINAGVAEQNMISVSAALARQGFEVWAYSIAPFCYARPFEQVRNDVAFHNLRVKLVGNGGGYGYGVMGPTHHALEDYGVLLTLPNMHVFAPVFDEDINAVVNAVGNNVGPCYLRLGRGEPPPGYAVPAYSPWRRLVDGGGAVVVAVGPLASTYIEPLRSLPVNVRPALWAVSELPIERNPMPEELLDDLSAASALIVAEEHVRYAGFASDFLMHLVSAGIAVNRFVHHFALAHNYGVYGSQTFLRELSGLDSGSVIETIRSLTTAMVP